VLLHRLEFALRQNSAPAMRFAAQYRGNMRFVVAIMLALIVVIDRLNPRPTLREQ
jgi:hypothetical protein